METEKKKSPTPELSFRPLTDGLGFHPFSDGLPYAPISKIPTGRSASPAPMGTGAVAAGPASFAREAPRVSVPVARPMAPQPFAPQPRQATPEPVTPEPYFVENEYGLGYAFARFFAYLFDTLINVVLCVGALSTVLWRQDVAPTMLLTPGVVVVSALFVLFFHWAVVTAQEIAFGTTIGKRIFGLTIPGSALALLLRSIFFIPSTIFCGLGVLWGVFDSRKRCWHDLVAGVQPERLPRL